MIDDIPHSEGLPHTWDDEGELVLHLLEEHNSADSLDGLTQEVSDTVYYVLSQHPPGMPTPNCTGKNVPENFFLRLHMMAELMSL